MKHSEFVRKIEELGFEVDDDRAGIKITYENAEVARVGKRHEAVMDNYYSIPRSKELRVKLFDILVEYAKTPIQDREDQKKYSIHPIRTMDYKLVRFEAIFRECGYEDEDSFDIAFPAPYEKGVSTTFSESEAREICDYFGWDFDKVAVEVDDEE